MIPYIKTVFFLFIIFYFLGVISGASFNPFEWKEEVRYFFGVGGGGIIIFSLVFVNKEMEGK